MSNDPVQARLVPRFLIAGTHSGVGKTTVTLALLAAFTERGRRVQAFKVGPDFIDPGHHTAVTGRPSRNLDGWMLGPTVNHEIFSRAAADADLSIVEGVMGLFDGASPISEVGSTAELAKRLNAPVLLVLDGSGVARSVAAMALGYARFDSALRVAGVLFNRIGSEGHYRLLKEAVEAETNLAVVGCLRSDPTIAIGDRHLGLVTALEQGSRDLYERLGQVATETVDLDRVESLARSAGPLTREAGEQSLLTPPASRVTGKPVRVGVAYDPAFCFYYQENLELLEAEGAEVVRFSPLHDQALPDVELLYLGGGYPELHAKGLADNRAVREAIRAFAAAGGTIYAECGGLMYLMQAIRDFDGRSHEMVGLFPAEAVMRKPGLTIGYREVEINRPCVLGEPRVRVRGHEFHHSVLVPTGPLDYACRVTDARGHERTPDGLVTGNVVALYTHLHFASQPGLARALIVAARKRGGLGTRPGGGII